MSKIVRIGFVLYYCNTVVSHQNIVEYIDTQYTWLPNFLMSFKYSNVMSLVMTITDDLLQGM